MSQRAKLNAIGDGKPADPTFTTRADLEAWAKDMTATVVTAVAFAKTADPKHARSIWDSALAQLRRVTIAHLHLPDAGHEREEQRP